MSDVVPGPPGSIAGGHARTRSTSASWREGRAACPSWGHSTAQRCPGHQDTKAKQNLAPAAGDAAALRLSSEMAARGDGAVEQEADEAKHREVMP